MATINQLLTDFLFKKSLFKGYLRRQIPYPYKIKLRQPIFVIGSSRSGTSILADVLGCCPCVRHFTEHPIVRRHMWSMVENPELINFEMRKLEKTLVRLSNLKSGRRLLEKTPGHSLVANDLATYFADASFIHIVRDGRDVVSSMLKHSWISRELRGEVKVFWLRYLPETYQKQWQNLNSWERGILRWAVYVTAARKAQSHSERYFEVNYEDICLSPQKSMKQILRFLQLEPFQDFEQQVARINPSSAKRWQKENLSDEQLTFYQKVLSESQFNVSRSHSLID